MLPYTDLFEFLKLGSDMVNKPFKDSGSIVIFEIIPKPLPK